MDILRQMPDDGCDFNYVMCQHMILFTTTPELDPFNGYELLRALPAYVGVPLLFWHSDGEN